MKFELKESPLVNKIIAYKEHLVNNDANVSDLINNTKKWCLDNLRNRLPTVDRQNSMYPYLD